MSTDADPTTIPYYFRMTQSDDLHDSQAADAMTKGVGTNDAAIPGDGMSNGNPSALPRLSFADIISAVQCGDTVDLVERFSGDKITSDTVASISQKLQQKIGQETHARAPSFNNKEQSLIDSIDAAIKLGKVETRSGLGNKFRSDSQAQDIKGMSNKEAAEFRMQWAMNLKQELIASKTVDKAWTRIDTNKYTYRPYGKMVLDFGGWSDPDAIKGATTGVLQCLLMGPPFIKQHPQTKMTLYAIAEIGWEETFTQSWRHTIEYYAGDDDEAPKGSKRHAMDNGDDGTPRKVQKMMSQGHKTDDHEKELNDGKCDDGVKAKAKAKPKAKSKANVKSDDTPTKVDDGDDGKAKAKAKAKIGDGNDTKVDPKKKLVDLMKNAMKLKGLFNSATMRAERIISEVAKDGRFAWARQNDKGDRLIQSKIDILRSSTTDWMQEFLLEKDFNTMRKKYEGSVIIVELTNFMQSEKMVDDLDRTCDAFVNASEVMQALGSA
jgi:hypothetical protein